MTLIGNSNIYSSIFFNNTSSGAVDIHYSKRSATAIVDGWVYTMGLASPLKNGDLFARGGRITPVRDGGDSPDRTKSEDRM